MIKSKLIPIAILLALSAITCQTEQKISLQLSPLFSDHMVLQQKDAVNIWGEFTPGGKITVRADWGAAETARVDAAGKWQVKLNTPEAGGPYRLNIETSDTMLVLQDVMVGEVWLASGQSNMEMPVKGWPPRDTILNSSQEIATANDPGIRMFTVAKKISDHPLDTISGEWVVASPETVGDFSATAYFFARRLSRELEVPVGIIHASWGGTVVEAWTSESGLRKIGDFDTTLDELKSDEDEQLTASWFQKFPKQEIPKTNEEWQEISFADMAAAQPDFEGDNWYTLKIPGRFDTLNNSEFNGAVWLRSTFTVADPGTDYVLRMAKVDDMDATYINGQKVGGLAGNGFWNVPREMKIPGSLLHEGENSIAIRAIDNNGPGVVEGPVSLTNSKGDSISLEGDWQAKLVAEMHDGYFYVYDLEEDLTDRPRSTEIHPNVPTVLYNAMIHPLIPYTIKGAIWYQGEANVSRAEQYKILFPTMIGDWRSKWNAEFPFYYVQIAPFMYQREVQAQKSQELRDAQRLALGTPKTGMVVTLDIGNPTNIHPANKQDVGARLAGLALSNDYGKELVASGPLFRQAERSGSVLRVTFDHVGSGLVAAENGLGGFELAGEDKVYLPAEARITGDQVEVQNPAIPVPVYVRYAWRDDSVASLFNREGLPASGFSSEASTTD